MFNVRYCQHIRELLSIQQNRMIHLKRLAPKNGDQTLSQSTPFGQTTSWPWLFDKMLGVSMTVLQYKCIIQTMLYSLDNLCPCKWPAVRKTSAQTHRIIYTYRMAYMIMNHQSSLWKVLCVFPLRVTVHIVCRSFESHQPILDLKEQASETAISVLYVFWDVNKIVPHPGLSRKNTGIIPPNPMIIMFPMAASTGGSPVKAMWKTKMISKFPMIFQSSSHQQVKPPRSVWPIFRNLLK